MPENESNSRLEICLHCPIYNEGQCSDKLRLNPKTNEITTKNKFGFIKGCGCKVKIKVLLPDEHCPCGKW
jgi:hypothetical protein